MPPSPRRRAVLGVVARVVLAGALAAAAFGAVAAYPRSHVAGNRITGPDDDRGYGLPDPRSPRVFWGPDQRSVEYSELVGPDCFLESVQATSDAPARLELRIRRFEVEPCRYTRRSDPLVVPAPTVFTPGQNVRVSIGYRVLLLRWPVRIPTAHSRTPS